jgi:hypothetical protein
MSKLEERLKEVFSTERSKDLAGILDRAYRANMDCYAPDIGHDLMIFGLMVHKSMRRFLVDLSKQVNWITVLQFSPRFLFRIGEFTMSAYRAGDSVDADIAHSFPKNRTGAWSLAEANKGQMSFSFVTDGTVQPDDSNCSSLILAHVGNPTDGLCSLFVGVPADFDEKNMITEWSTTYLIWTKANSAAAPVISVDPDGPELPPAEHVKPPVITLKGERKSESR